MELSEWWSGVFLAFPEPVPGEWVGSQLCLRAGVSRFGRLCGMKTYATHKVVLTALICGAALACAGCGHAPNPVGTTGTTSVPTPALSSGSPSPATGNTPSPGTSATPATASTTPVPGSGTVSSAQTAQLNNLVGSLNSQLNHLSNDVTNVNNDVNNASQEQLP